MLLVPFSCFNPPVSERFVRNLHRNRLFETALNRSFPGRLQNPNRDPDIHSVTGLHPNLLPPNLRGHRFIIIRKCDTFINEPLTPFQDACGFVFVLPTLSVGHHQHFLFAHSWRPNNAVPSTRTCCSRLFGKSLSAMFGISLMEALPLLAFEPNSS